jgi:hypothetical protein
MTHIQRHIINPPANPYYWREPIQPII